MSWRATLVSHSGAPNANRLVRGRTLSTTAADVQRILVIHDDPGSRQALDQILVPAGYDVVAVAYPPVAIMDAFLLTKPALVVLDIGLSGQKPVEDLCRQLRRESKEVPIVVLGSTSEVADRVSLLDLGADDYITKPFDGTEFLARVTARTNWLTRRRR
jgi:DNA-binding response OmpR family regulator